MTLNLDDITRALDEATPGPWLDYCILNISTGGSEHRVNNPHLGVDVARCGNDAHYSRQDAHLIAHAPEWLRLLVERVRKLENGISEIASMREMFPDDPLIVGLCDKAEGLLEEEWKDE